MENEIPRLSTVWENSLTNLLGHDPTTEPGMALRHWVHFQGVHSILDLLSWDPEELKSVTTQQLYSLDIQGQYIHLRTNQVKQMCGLITCMKHIFESYNSGIEPPDDPFHPFSPDECAQHIPTQMRTYLVQYLQILMGLNQFLLEPYPQPDLQVTQQQQ